MNAINTMNDSQICTYCNTEAQLNFALGVLPLILKSSEFSPNVEYSGWKLFLFIINHKLGNEQFRRLIAEYMSERRSE